jgi:hypothetical protein
VAAAAVRHPLERLSAHYTKIVFRHGGTRRPRRRQASLRDN